MSSIDDHVKIVLTNEQKEFILENLDSEGKLKCLKAFKVAKKINKELIDMSAVTKSLNIKITDCELGVFGKIDFDDKDENVYKSLKQKFVNSNKISCKELFEEAKNSSLRKVGSTVKNADDIDVINCQLGCFREKKAKVNKIA